MKKKSNRTDLPGIAWTFTLALGSILLSWVTMRAMMAFMGLDQ